MADIRVKICGLKTPDEIRHVAASGAAYVGLNFFPASPRYVTPALAQSMALAALFGLHWSVQVPLFIVLFGGAAAGLAIGFLWEWLREHKHRANAAAHAREVARLEREVARTAPPAAKDDVLALLDPPRKAG